MDDVALSLFDRVGSEPEPTFEPVPAASSGTAAAASGPMELRLVVDDPEVLAELRRPRGSPVDEYAKAALRLGVMSLRMASGQLDATAVREAGQRLVSDMRELLTARASEMTSELSGTLTRYFDPQSGLVPQRLQSLVQQDGELERVLAQHLGPSESILARTLAANLGEGSPIFRMLSPGEAGGLLSQVTRALEQALGEQRTHVLREFSLDTKDSALSRLVAEITTRQGELRTDFKDRVETVVKEFSLDKPDSALSRLVGKVEAAQRAITANLTLDDEQSSLSRLRREVQGAVEELTRKNLDFHAEVRSTLASLQARREESARSTTHGLVFEDQLGTLLSAQAQGLGDVCTPCGASVGIIKNCKTGDHLIELGPESAAPGAKIIWEAKEDKSYDLRKARAEIDEARKNRSAQIGVFVFSKRTAPADLEPLVRYGSDLIVVWDAEDPTSDVYVKAAFSVARALSVRAATASLETSRAFDEIELATRTIGKQLGFLDEMRKQADTIISSGQKVVDRTTRMRAELEKEVARLDEGLASLKAGSTAGEVVPRG